MIPIFLVVNSTSTEPMIPLIDVAPFIAGTTIGITLSIAFLTYILRKDPTLRWRAQRKSWSYDFFKTPSNDIRILPIMEEDIDPTDNTFDYEYGGGKKDKGTFKLESVNDKKQVTQFTHKGHPAYIHTSDMMSPHAFTPNSLEASISPQAVYKCKDGQIRRQIDSIQVGDKTPTSNWGIIALVVIVIILIVAMYEQIGGVMNFLQDKFGSHASASNATVTCPTGYTPNTRGQCIPNGMPFTDLISILGLTIPIRISMKTKDYRQWMGLDKTRALVASISSMAFLPLITLFLISSKTTFVPITADSYNFDMIIIVTSAIFWFSAWKIGAITGDWLFRRNNKWSISMDLNFARKQFKILRKMRTSSFWLRIEQERRISLWLDYFYDSEMPLMTQIGGLP